MYNNSKLRSDGSKGDINIAIGLHGDAEDVFVVIRDESHGEAGEDDGDADEGFDLGKIFSGTDAGAHPEGEEVGWEGPHNRGIHWIEPAAGVKGEGIGFIGGML